MGACLAPMDDANGGGDVMTGGDATDGPGPTVNDEDNDGLLDSVDPCPISANNADADSDGVGDACEPIASGNDTIIRFEGFTAASLPGDATVIGTWTVSGGRAHNVSGANVASSVTFPITSPANDRETIMARVTVDALFSTPSDPTGAGAVTRTESSGATGIQCGLGRDPVSGTDHLLLVKMAAAADGRMNSNASLATVGTTAVVQITRNPSNDVFACNQNGTSTVSGIPASPVPTGSLGGIRTRSMSASFDWVMIIQTQ
jgi:hypothetical protein